jgi:hypothetical protein
MAWNRWYAFRSYLRSSLWIVPFIALLLEQVTFRAVYALSGNPVELMRGRADALAQ